MLKMNNDVMKRLARTFNSKIIINKVSNEVINGRREETIDKYFECWCNPKELYGKELYEAKNIKINNALTFEVRYCEKIRAMREETIKKKARFIVEFEQCDYEVYYIDLKNNSKEIVSIKANGVT